jgi:Rad3-related DNA helicase
MAWSLYSKEKFLEPLKFSNGKTQEDIVKEVLDLIEKGNKIIFIKGICGTGKSAIALNIARKIGKTSIVVPGKNLQSQYKKDYEENKYLLKNKKDKLKISVITGRNNHKCKFLEDNEKIIPKIKKEINSNLYDIFKPKKTNSKNKDLSADSYNLPCKIEIKNKNWNKIKEYLKQNKDIDYNNFSDLKDVKRVSVAGVCPYWCPVLQDKYELGGKSFVNVIKRKYKGLENTNFIFYQRKPGCKFYEQFNSFIDSDVIVFNSMKYFLETIMNRKPETEIEIIDECDEFLDKFSSQKNINIERLQNSLVHIFPKEEKSLRIIKELNEIIKQIKKNKKINEAIFSKSIIPLKETGIYDLIGIFLKNKEFLDEADDENYALDVEETSMMFKEFLDESYVIVNKKDNNLIISIVTINLAKRLKEIVDKNKVFVFMSGTIHSENVLKNVFGLKNFEIIDAEIEKQGRIEIKKTGLEKDCRYSNFSNGKFKRKDYLKSLDKCIEVSKKPTLIHVNAFVDLPSREEIKEFNLKNLINRENLREIQNNDKTGELVEKFKKGEEKVLFSTRSGRGIDFPGEQCNSIVFTKYPNPNVQDAFWKILHKTKPMHYWDFYKDKAKRELWQKIYRGLRFKEDHVYLLSPDLRVLEAIGG